MVGATASSSPRSSGISRRQRRLPPEPTARALEALAKWYRTGEASDRRAYDIAWVEDKASLVDTINGFTEVYLDARGAKGAWEGVVFYVNQDKTAMIRQLAAEAQWFEDHMPWDPKYRKAGVKGITANAIDVVVETGESGPTTPVGINLPNDEYVREHHGSKSVSLSNISEAYDKAADPRMRMEFSWTPEEAARTGKWGTLGEELTTDMHEVIGHASGKLAARFNGKADAALGEYYSALEEGRADLVGLYFLADPKLVELKLMSAADQPEIVKAEYEGYARNALLQLRRVRQGTQIEEDHMRNRQMIVHWLMANTKAHREACAGRQDLLRDGGCGGVPRRRGQAVGRGPAHQVRRGPRWRQEAVRQLRDPFRCHAA